MVSLGPVANVFYFVADLDAARDWYAELLGNEPVEVQPQLVMFAVGETRLTLHLEDEYNRGGDGRGSVVYWNVADVDEAVIDCGRRGANPHRGPKTIFTGERLVQVRDPFGNLLGLRQAPAQQESE